jgi:hypothetical protein
MILFVDYFFRVPFVGDATQILLNFVIVIAGFALGLGAGNIVLIHGQHIRKRTPR